MTKGVLSIIAARGGSKGLPRKNVIDLAGKPLIAWTIEASLKSKYITKTIVSSDDEEILEISRNYGAETPFIRPKNISDDLTPTVPVIAHAIESSINKGWSIDYACCIYPCVPFLQINDLIKSCEILVKADADFIYPVTEYAHPIQRAMRQLSSGTIQFIVSSREIT